MTEITPQLIQVFLCVRNNGDWLSAQEIADKTDMSPRTARRHAGHLSDEGVFERAAVWPAYKYRMADGGKAFVNRLEYARKAHGL